LGYLNKENIQLIIGAFKGENHDYTKLTLRRAVTLLAIPMVAEMLMESLFSVVDIFFVARLGSKAVAVVGITESVLTLIYSLAWGLSMAATAVVARRIGEGNREEASKASVQTLWLGLIVSVIIAVAGYFYTPAILYWMSGDEALVALGTRFTRIMLLGNGTILFLFLLNAIFRGAGDASRAMKALWLSNGMNIILDPLLIFGLGPIPELGLEGAAIASVLGRGTGVAYQLWHLFRGNGVIRWARRHFVFVKTTTIRLFTIGLQGSAQFLIASASWIFLMRIIADFGSDALAGYTIGIRIMIFVILPIWGMANAASTLVGQHLGAQQPDQAAKSAWLASKYAMVYMVVVTGIFLLAAPGMIGWFTQEPAVVYQGAISLRIISLGYFFYAYGIVISQAMNGAGDTRTPMWINLVGFWLIEIPLAWILAIPLGYGPEGVYASVAIAESLVAVACIYFFKKGRWKHVQV
jgi:putative MATE family efflux protein